VPNNLKDLVKDSSKDIQPDASLVRGRGLAGMLSEEATPAQGAAEHPQVDKSTSPQENMSTSRRGVDKSTSTHVNMSTSTQVGPSELKRPVKSYRLREDLTHQIEILAAQQRRKLYEVMEEALEEYLERSTGRV
jgi:hypothetical protein